MFLDLVWNELAWWLTTHDQAVVGSIPIAAPRAFYSLKINITQPKENALDGSKSTWRLYFKTIPFFTEKQNLLGEMFRSIFSITISP